MAFVTFVDLLTNHLCKTIFVNCSGDKMLRVAVFVLTFPGRKDCLQWKGS